MKVISSARPTKPSWLPPVSVALILWSLLLTLSVSVLLVSGPRTAPPFETLTVFRCDNVPLIASGGGRGSSIWQTTYTCRSANQIVYNQGIPPPSGAPGQLKMCLAVGGTLTLWRQPIPSPYGRAIFQAACNGTVYADYKTLATNYNSSKSFVRALAWLILTLSAWRLGLIGWHQYQRAAPEGNEPSAFPDS